MGSEEELISIIIPVYKVEKYIDRCIQSILNQTYTNFEIILIDDASPDKCPQICDDYSKRYSNISVIHLENSNEGVSDARNAGVEKANGKYITFIDSDDYVHERILEVLINTLHIGDVPMSMCSYSRVYDTNDELNINESTGETIIIDDTKAMEALITDQTTSAVWGKLYAKSLFNGVSFPVGKHNEDMFVTPIIYKNAKQIAVSSHKLYYYYQQGESLCRAEFNYNMLDRIDAINFWKSHAILNYPELVEKIDMHYFSNILNISQNLVGKKDEFGVKKYDAYKKEILNNYKYIYHSKFTTRNNKIKTLLIKYNIFKTCISLFDMVKSKNGNQSI